MKLEAKSGPVPSPRTASAFWAKLKPQKGLRRISGQTPVAKPRPPADASPAPPKNPEKIASLPKRINPKRYVMAVTIPSWIACRPELSNAAKLTYGYLVQLWNPYVRCAFPSEADLARALGCSPRTARRAISELRGLKLIRSKSDSIKMPKWKAPKRKRVYRFLKHPWALGAKKLPKKRPSSHPPVIEEDKP